MPDTPTSTPLPLFDFDPETKRIMFLHDATDAGTGQLTAPKEITDFAEGIVFSYMGKDNKVISRMEKSPRDLFRLFEAILNNRGQTDNPLHKYVPLNGTVKRLNVYAVDRATKKATHTLIELKVKGKGDKARVIDVCHVNPDGKGNHPNMVALGVAFTAFKKANIEENEMENKNALVRMAYSVKDWVAKAVGKMMGWARSFLGWNLEQRYAILGAVCSMFGGMWFWFIMGGSLPIYVFGLTNALWFATAVGFVSMYAVLAYLTYAVAYAIIAGLVWLKNTIGEFMTSSEASVSPEMTAAAANA